MKSGWTKPLNRIVGLLAFANEEKFRPILPRGATTAIAAQIIVALKNANVRVESVRAQSISSSSMIFLWWQ